MRGRYTMAQSDVDKLVGVIGADNPVLFAWDFATNVSGEVLLSEKIDPASRNWKVWQYESGAWSAYTPSMLTFSADGTLSFSADHFSGYAVSVPEPGGLVMLALGAGVLVRRGRRARAGRGPQGVRRLI